MGQGVVHVLHVHHVVLLIPDAVLPRKEVREELGESQRRDRHGGDVDGWGRGSLWSRPIPGDGGSDSGAQRKVSWPQVPRFVRQKAQITSGQTDTFHSPV